MQFIHIKDVDLNEAFFHFTDKENLQFIKKEGLKAKCGDASKMVGDKARVCFSQGGKGLMGIKNSLLYELKHLRICDIPKSYRRYFSISSFDSMEIVERHQVYEAMMKKFQDEVYLVVDAILEEDYLEEEIFGLTASFDIKGIENHDIAPSKVALVVSDGCYSALDIMRYVYERMEQVFSEEMLKEMIGEVCDFFYYVDNYKNVEKSR